MEDLKSERTVPCDNVVLRDWRAWILLVPGHNELFVAGDVRVLSYGIDPILVPREPQGDNPRILLLDLSLQQKTGPGVIMWKTARYSRIVVGPQYDEVVIFCGAVAIETMKVKVR